MATRAWWLELSLLRLLLLVDARPQGPRPPHGTARLAHFGHLVHARAGGAEREELVAWSSYFCWGIASYSCRVHLLFGVVIQALNVCIYCAHFTTGACLCSLLCLLKISFLFLLLSLDISFSQRHPIHKARTRPDYVQVVQACHCTFCETLVVVLSLTIILTI